ncbi:type II toxin-antitoxin system RelE/ParE family toxin [Conchiformibius kuhniae]|uniref:Type II toxin-antitoxin system RelE/ParE family toxin n=1 Tax=Conchiformibius kuhniae TaxID=211502 RepID=A0A8T9MX32_9NEIS|nr:type II toxin-antitoxin system RelE/ParE family toxin [Conchiformibius kuhniae]
METNETVEFLSNTQKCISAFPAEVQAQIQQNFTRIGKGQMPLDFVPMSHTIGNGVVEMRIQYQNNIYRVAYVTARQTIYVLHAFQKKSQRTPKPDVDLIKRRLKYLAKRRIIRI